MRSSFLLVYNCTPKLYVCFSPLLYYCLLSHHFIVMKYYNKFLYNEFMNAIASDRIFWMFIFEIHKFKFDQRPVNSMLNLQFCLFIGSGGEIPTCDWLILRQQTVAGTFELFCFVTQTFGKTERSTQASILFQRRTLCFYQQYFQERQIGSC